jgi:hypothetical protein
MLAGATTTVRPMGDQVFAFQLDQRHAYLQDHVIDGTPVLPAAAALELLAEAAAGLWPGWKVVEVRDHKLMKGVELKQPTRAMQIVVSPPPYGSSEGFEVTAALQSLLPNGVALTHYRAVIRLEQLLPQAEPCKPGVYRDKTVLVADAYRDWLSHGPIFQVIEDIPGLSAKGSLSMVRSSHPSQWLPGVAPASAAWCFDPVLLDAAAQMAWVWARAVRDETALPVKFGRVVRYTDQMPARMKMEFERTESSDPSLVTGNVRFYDEHGSVLMLIEDIESIASVALNRLGGSVRTVVKA